MPKLQTRSAHPIMATRPTQISCVLLKKRRFSGRPSREAVFCSSSSETPVTYLGSIDAAEMISPRNVACHSGLNQIEHYNCLYYQ